MFFLNYMKKSSKIIVFPMLFLNYMEKSFKNHKKSCILAKTQNHQEGCAPFRDPQGTGFQKSLDLEIF